MNDQNRQWLLKRRPSGLVEADDFDLAVAEVPSIDDGQFLIRQTLFSLDPAMRGWIADEPNYLPPVALGAVMRGLAAGEVVESRHPDFAPGDLVSGLNGWQEWAVGDGLTSKLPDGVDAETALSVLGMTSITAYFGLLDVGALAEGETVLVSGAAGATGSIAGQIARLRGCWVVGIAGGPEKCGWLTGEAGFDAAIDYKADDVGERLGELCPDGVDVFFDNVGGDVLDAVLPNLALRGRVVVCGSIVRFGPDGPPPGPRNYFQLIQKRARMEGFVILDYLGRVDEALSALRTWVDAGELVWRVDVQRGFEHLPEALIRLYEGANRGKQLLAI